MADLTIPQHDTWPPLRGAASDDDGLMDLTLADSLKVLLKSGATLISGTAVAIALPGDPDGMNWSYTWHANDTAITGTYNVELEITWDSGASPPKVETVPNEDPLQVEIRADLG